MARLELLSYADLSIVRVCGEGRAGSAADQLTALVEECWRALASEGLASTDLVFSRLWMRERADAAAIAEVRERLLRGPARSASSSFYSGTHFVGSGAVALELLACRAARPDTRRLVDFSPPRRYAHYLVQDDWLFLSGMAEAASTMDGQFDASFAQVQAALDREAVPWTQVVEANLFLERGQADLPWLRRRFAAAAPHLPPRVSYEYVDGLATADKHLEIEVVARL